MNNTMVSDLLSLVERLSLSCRLIYIQIAVFCTEVVHSSEGLLLALSPRNSRDYIIQITSFRLHHCQLCTIVIVTLSLPLAHSNSTVDNDVI